MSHQPHSKNIVERIVGRIGKYLLGQNRDRKPSELTRGQKQVIEAIILFWQATLESIVLLIAVLLLIQAWFR